MEYEKKLFADSIQNYIWAEQRKEYLNRILNSPSKNPKSAAASERARKKGNNALLQQKKHDAQTHKTIFDHYCESVALAPINSEVLALAYGNRSYFLLHINKYEDCIKDIDRALKILTASDVLKAKLLCRKAECLKRLGLSNFSSILEIAQSYVDKIDGQDRMKFLQMVEAVQALSVEKTNNVEVENQKEKIELPPLTDDYLSRISIQHDKKYGRHLVAARDYEPGDIIFVENIYVSAFDKGSSPSLSACDYCSKQTWSSIPCNCCDWSMYCCENCKEKAWNEFHDIECSVISCLREYPETAWKPDVVLMRVLIKAIKETGSIANLKKELESVDHCKDAATRGFFKNDQLVLHSIRNIYSLATDNLFDEHYIKIARVAIPKLLACLTKHYKLENNFNVKQVEDLFINEDIMFLGPLLIRISAVLNLNAFKLQAINQELSVGYSCKPFRCKSVVSHLDESRGLSSLYSLLNHSCCPTAAYCCTEPNKLFVFALQPIKKNSQIFVSYHGSFDMYTQTERQANVFEVFNFTCDCPACTGAWPPVSKVGAVMGIDVENDVINSKFDYENLLEIQKFYTEDKLMDLKEKHITMLSPLIKLGSHWRQPSQLFWLMIQYLTLIFVTIYSRKSQIFDKCE